MPKIIGENIDRLCNIAVSYTHLLIAVSIAVFLLLSLSPNDPALLILGANASEADLEMFREQHGLNPVSYTHLDVYKRQH